MLLAMPALRGAPFAVTENFLTFLIEGRNPNAAAPSRKVTVANLGLRADGKYYPYSTPNGRRIGFELPVQSVFEYTTGITVAEAQNRLRAAVEATATELSVYIPAHFPGRTFEQLDQPGQEMLVDYALSEGAVNLPPVFVDAVYSANRVTAIGGNCLHIRWWGGMMQVLKNRAFGYRWLGN